MKKNNKLIALAVAVAVMGPTAAPAASTPVDVGNVTLMGNIVANSPMWQWTVNEYPGSRLDAKPSEATTANGQTTYKLDGRPFIAVSGYLPSFVPIKAGPQFLAGTIDKTSFTDGSGAPISNVADQGKGMVLFDIAASGTNSSGEPVQGRLSLTSTEIRGYRYATHTNTDIPGNRYLSILATTIPELPLPGGSCFSGVGSYSSPTTVVSGTAVTPAPGEQSVTAFSAFVDALTAADNTGAATKFAVLPNMSDRPARGEIKGCDTESAPVLVVGDTGPILTSTLYTAAAHVSELTPVSLTFPQPVSGAWNATLNVTAYQM